MRKYLKPALEMEAFDVEDIITVSTTEVDQGNSSSSGGNQDREDFAATPIDVINLN